MKICILTTGHSIFDDRIYFKEVMSLKKNYNSIIVIAPGDGIRSHSGVEFQIIRKAYSLKARILAVPVAFVKLLKNQPDICHFHDFELIFIVPILRVFSRCKIIYDVHEVYPEMIQESRKLPRLLRPILANLVDLSEKIISRFVHCIIASDDSIAERFINTGTHVVTIFNYPRLSIFTWNKIKTAKLGKNYLNKTPIIYQGSITEDRGLFIMLKAMNIIKRKRPDIILLLVGHINSKLLDATYSMIKEHKLQNNVEIIGSVPHKEIANYISISKLGLIPFLPTRKYLKNIPIKQFEYMACGVPVLGANLPPIASYINSSRCGKVFDSGKAEKLASGILEILENEKEWIQMSDAGKNAVKNMWNWDRMEERLFNVYSQFDLA